MPQYTNYGKIQIDGAQDYVAGVTGCLDVIDSNPGPTDAPAAHLREGAAIRLGL